MSESTITVSELVAFLQDLELDDAVLDELVTMLAKEGLTEKTCRRVQSVLANTSSRDFAELEKQEKILDLIVERDAAIDKIVHESDQEMGRIDMKTMSTLNGLKRKVNEDVEASEAGATLLLHSDDVVSDESPTNVPAMSPKQAASAVIEASKSAASLVSPDPMTGMPVTNDVPASANVPVTLSPLPPTPMAPQPAQ